jgi:N-acetylmuramoyl-L-alanine amidase
MSHPPRRLIARSEVSAARSADFLISILADWVTKDSSSGSEIGSDQA